MPEFKTVLPNANFVIEGYVDPREPLRRMPVRRPWQSAKCEFGTANGKNKSPALRFQIRHSSFAICHSIHPATIVGIPPMEDFYIGGASVKLFLPIFKMNFPEIVDIALPAEGVFHNLVFVSIRKTYLMQAYKIMHGLWVMGQMMFTKYRVVLDDDLVMSGHS